MRTNKGIRTQNFVARVLRVFFYFVCLSITANAQDSGSSRIETPEESNSETTPYLQYGDFQSSDEEAETLKYFQYGRFFGISAGAGYMGATGNLGVLYNDSIPAIDVRVHYWFDFNFALTLGLGYNKFQFTGGLVGTPNSIVKYDVTVFRLEALFRYYFDTYNASAPISFASPFLVAGLGNYSRTRTDTTDSNPETAVERADALGFSFGAGTQFTLKPKAVYLDMEFRLHSAKFPDSSSPVELGNNNTLPNQTGLLTSFLVSLLFTW